MLIRLILLMVVVVSCEIVDDDVEKHVDAVPLVSLEEVAEVLAHVSVDENHLREVHKAVTSSLSNGYDEEYTVTDMFSSPGAGVGDAVSGVVSRSPSDYPYPLFRLIEDYVYSSRTVKSSTMADDPERWLDALKTSDMQIYWPFSEKWDGSTMPVITFDPEDGAETNVGYRLVTDDEGKRHVEEVVVTEQMAEEVPVWVMNRNSDAGFLTLEMLRRDDPEWGTGGGSITVTPKSLHKGTGTLILKDFTARRHYDSWFAGASEFSSRSDMWKTSRPRPRRNLRSMIRRLPIS